MTLQEICSYGGIGFVVLLTLVEVVPIKINPWSAIAKALGRAINKEVLQELESIKSCQKGMKSQLEKHIKVDDARNADTHRMRILQFNNELIRDLPHTREDFIEVLSEIDEYKAFCEEHPDYPNSRAEHAVANIERVYDARLEKHDFYKAD